MTLETIHMVRESEYQVLLTVAGNTWRSAIDSAKGEIGSQRRVPGFRMGRAPKFLSTKDVPEKSVLNKAMQLLKTDCERRAYDEIVQSGQRVVAEPRVMVEELTAEHALIRIYFPIAPTFELPDYKSIQVEMNANMELTRQDVIVNTANIMRDRYPLESTEANEVIFHDSISITFSIRLEGEEADPANSGAIDVVVGSGMLLPTIEERLIGMRVGQEDEFSLTFPAFYPKVEFREKPGYFRIKIEKITRLLPPKLTLEQIHEATFTQIGSLLAFDQYIERIAQNSKVEYARHIFRREYLNALLPLVDINFSEQHIFQNQKFLLDRFLQGLRNNSLTLEEYLRDTGSTQDTIYQELRNETIKALKTQALLERIVEVEGITATAEERTHLLTLLSRFHLLDEDTTAQRYPQHQLDSMITDGKLLKLLMNYSAPQIYAELAVYDYFNLDIPLDTPPTALAKIHEKGESMYQVYSGADSQ